MAANVVIDDSMSHEHIGAGGYLEAHEAELDRLAGKDWGKREAGFSLDGHLSGTAAHVASPIAGISST